MRLLLIEDEPRVQAFIVRGLQENEHVVDVASEGEEGLALARGNRYDVILLDVMLPGHTDGFDVAASLRAEGDSTPIVMLTARESTDDIVRGLEAGADDYVTKPFDFVELEARLRALARRGGPVHEPILRFGSIELDSERRVVRRAGHTFRIPRAGSVWSRMMRLCWRACSAATAFER